MPLAAQPPSCEGAIGQWAWFTRAVVTIKPGGAMVHEPGNDGTWTCARGSKTIITLRWRIGGFVNTMELSADGKRLSSTDPSQAMVTGTRIGAATSSGKVPPSSTRPESTSTPTSQPVEPASPPTPDSGPASTGDPGKGFQAFLEGRRLAQSGRCSEAMVHLNRALQFNPRHAKAYSDRGRCSAMLGQPSQAIIDLNRAVQLAPSDMSSYFNRAGLRADTGDGDGALADLDRAVHLDPMNPAPRGARGVFLETAGAATEGKADLEIAYRQVDTLAPKRRPILDQVVRNWRRKSARLTGGPTAAATGDPMQAAVAALGAGRARSALFLLDAALTRNPNDTGLLALRARVRLDLGQAAGAIEDLTAFLQRNPNASAFTDRGRALRQLCRFREELADYDRATRQNPAFAAAYLERGFTMTHYQKGNDPAPYLAKAIELDPRNWLAYYLRGQEYGYWQNKLPLAMADYRRVVELKPDFAPAYCNMAFALREARRMSEVDGWLQKCFALDPSEREVTSKVFAKIQAGEEQSARDMVAMAEYFRRMEEMRKTASNKRQCDDAGGQWNSYSCY
jgi:tetratricopeptide (TPR) repeat protein